MSFANTQYLPHIMIAALIFTGLLIYLNFKYFNWVKSYWFFERSWMSRLSGLIYLVSIFLMLISLLDLRGPEEKVKSLLPDQRTIIILDSSASMLAEDVRPSRFGKAIQLARHFVKNAAGHQVSIVLFSDIQKRLIPFTDDLDLLDSRLAALEKTNAVSGGSSISQAIAESVGYFDFDGDRKATSGNILVFTDAEESEGAFDAELGNNINLAVVGIGTAKGSNIPLRWEDGAFRGYKNQKGGQQVITRLDEEYIKKLGKNVKNYKYWIANSYSLPTDDIMNFFRGTYNKSNNKGDMRVRPVFSYLILIPAILLYCVSVVLGRFASFKTPAIILIFSIFVGSGEVYAQNAEGSKPKEIPLTLKKDMERMRSGKADRKEILKLAENLLRNNDNDRANELYKEYSRAEDEQEITFNRATALLKSQKLEEAMPLIQNFFKNSKDEAMKDKLRNNIIISINDNGPSKSQNQDDKKEEGNKGEQNQKDNKNDKGKEGKEDKDSKDSKESNESKNKKDQKENGNSTDNKNQKNKDSKDKQDNKESRSDKDQKEEKPPKDPKDLDKPERPDLGPKSLEEKEKMIEQKRKMVKIPTTVKQIMNDDRELQKKMMDTSTDDRSSRTKRDW